MRPTGSSCDPPIPKRHNYQVTSKTAVVTGAGSGIGAATARALTEAGFKVFCMGRRGDRISAIAEEIGGVPVVGDVTNLEDVANLATQVGGKLNVLVNNAGGAIGLDPVVDSNPEDWREMFESNVIGTLNVTKALIGALEASSDGVIINMGSIAGHLAYEGGSGYTAAKHAVAVMTETLRLELNGKPIRICEIAPGMVKTEEFSLNRFKDQRKADAVYAGVAAPLLAEDIADAVTWVATRPAHVNIDLMTIKPVAQAAPHKVARK